MWWIISSFGFILQRTLFVSKVSAALLRYVLNLDLLDIGALVCCGLLLATVVYGVTHQLVLRKPSIRLFPNKLVPRVAKAAASPALRSLSTLSSLFGDTLLWVACGIAVLLCEVLSTLNVLCWGLCIVAAYTLFAFLQGIYCVFRTIDYVILEVYYLGENTWESFYKVNHELVQSARDPILSAVAVITKTASTSVEFSLDENRALVQSLFGPFEMDGRKEVQADMRVLAPNETSVDGLSQLAVLSAYTFVYYRIHLPPVLLACSVVSLRHRGKLYQIKVHVPNTLPRLRSAQPAMHRRVALVATRSSPIPVVRRVESVPSTARNKRKATDDVGGINDLLARQMIASQSSLPRYAGGKGFDPFRTQVHTRSPCREPISAAQQNIPQSTPSIPPLTSWAPVPSVLPHTAPPCTIPAPQAPIPSITHRPLSPRGPAPKFETTLFVTSLWQKPTQPPPPPPPAMQPRFPAAPPPPALKQAPQVVPQVQKVVPPVSTFVPPVFTFVPPPTQGAPPVMPAWFPPPVIGQQQSTYAPAPSGVGAAPFVAGNLGGFPSGAFSGVVQPQRGGHEFMGAGAFGRMGVWT